MPLARMIWTRVQLINICVSRSTRVEAWQLQHRDLNASTVRQGRRNRGEGGRGAMVTRGAQPPSPPPLQFCAEGNYCSYEVKTVIIALAVRNPKCHKSASPPRGKCRVKIFLCFMTIMGMEWVVSFADISSNMTTMVWLCQPPNLNYLSAATGSCIRPQKQG